MAGINPNSRAPTLRTAAVREPASRVGGTGAEVTGAARTAGTVDSFVPPPNGRTPPITPGWVWNGHDWVRKEPGPTPGSTKHDSRETLLKQLLALLEKLLGKEAQTPPKPWDCTGDSHKPGKKLARAT